MDRVTVLDHPLGATLLSRLRSADTEAEVFRASTRRLGALLAMEALRAVPARPRSVRTPLGEAPGTELEGGIVAVPVLRAGLGLLEPVTTLAPEADVGVVGVRRDEEQLVPLPYVAQLPPLVDATVLVLEPMLATGGSASHALRLCADAGAARLVVVSVVAAPEGIARLGEQHPDARVVVAGLDEGLDDNGFIVPGLGDFGDRLLGTT